MACRTPKCNCAQFTASRWQATKCDCGHSQGQHTTTTTTTTTTTPTTAATTATTTTTIPAVTTVTTTTTTTTANNNINNNNNNRTSTTYNKPLPRNDKPLPLNNKPLPSIAAVTKPLSAGKDDSTTSSIPTVTAATIPTTTTTSSSSSSSTSISSASISTPTSTSGSEGRRLSVSNRTSRVPSPHHHSNSSTTTLGQALQASTTIQIQPRPSTTTPAKATAHNTELQATNATSAINELKEYLSECKEEATNFVDMEAEWKKAYNDHIKSLEANFEELHQLLTKRQESLKQEIDTFYQHKINEMNLQKNLAQNAVDNLSKTMDFCKENIQNEKEVILKAKQAITQVPNLYEIQLEFEPVPFHMSTLQRCINQIGVQSSDTYTDTHSNLTSSKHSGIRDEKRSGAPKTSSFTSETNQNQRSQASSVISNQDMKSIVDTMFRRQPGNDTRPKTVPNQNIPQPVDEATELTEREMASYGFSDDEEDSDGGKKRIQLYRSNVRTESNVDEKSPSATPVKNETQPQPIAKDLWDGESDDD